MYEKNGKAYVSEEEYLHNIREIEENEKKHNKRRMKIILVSGFVLCVLSYYLVKFLEYLSAFHQ